MLLIRPVRKSHSFRGALLSFLALAASLILLVQASEAIQSRTRTDRLSTLRDAIWRASVQCYAIEGRYPPSIEYLEEHYGIVIDRERFYVFYDGWASNVMPEITVLPAQSADEKERRQAP